MTMLCMMCAHHEDLFILSLLKIGKEYMSKWNCGKLHSIKQGQRTV